MNYKKLSEKVKSKYPIGLKIEWECVYNSGFQKGTGKITSHIEDEHFNLLYAVVQTKSNGVKHIIIADFDVPDFKLIELKSTKPTSIKE